MAGETSIEWADASWNPIVGCSVVSPGCTNCYAMRMAAGIERMRVAGWRKAGIHAPHGGRYEGMTQKSKASGAMENQMLRSTDDGGIERLIVWTETEERWFRCGQDFAAAMHAEVGRMEYPRDFGWGLKMFPLPNLWLGVSAEDQARADERIPDLLATPAAVRFVSAEPLLRPIDFTRIAERAGLDAHWSLKQAGLDWIIVGGESGPDARPMHPDWARSIRDQCQAAGVQFFLKQWGEWATVFDRDRDDPDWRRCDTVLHETPNGQWLNLAGGRGFHGDRVVRVDRFGKRRAGRLLDGVEHNAFPEIAR